MIIYATELRFYETGAAAKILAAATSWLSRKAREVVPDSVLEEDHTIRMGAGMQLQTWCDKTVYPHLYAFRLTHGDRDVRGRQWITELGVEDPGGGGVVRATVLLQTSEISARVQSTPQTSRPLLVDEILKSCAAVADTPGTSIRSLTSESARGFEFLVSDDRRDHPLIVVSATANGRFLVDPERLRSFVAGLAEVITIPPGEDTFELADILGPDHVAWLGAVNVVFPTRTRGIARFTPRVRLMPDELSEIDSEGRSPEAEVLSIVSHRTNLPMSKRHVRPEDVREAAIGRAMSRRRQDAQESGSGAELLSLYEESEREQKREILTLKGKVSALEEELLQREDDAEGLSEDKRRLSFQIESLKATLGNSPRSSALGTTVTSGTDYRDAVLDAIAGSPTLEQSLLIIETLFPDRVVVLDTAWKAARDAVGFTKTRAAFELLRTLATEYWEDMARGRGDNEARRHFGNSYAPRESETVTNNKKARELRTFEYEGKPIEMWRHLKIGVKPSVAEAMRVHFHWDDAGKKIVVGHCGRHLDHK